MRQILIITTLLFNVLSAAAQTVTRADNETAEAFVQRLKPDTMELAHPVVETNAWDSSTKAIIACFGYDDANDPNTGFNSITGHLYLPTGTNQYREITFGPIEEDGGYPEIISVFFANADKDKAKELLVLCKYDQRHYDYQGEFYETFIFDDPHQGSHLTYLEKLSEKFGGCECGWRNGRTEKAKYKTAKAIKARLKQLGFN